MHVPLETTEEPEMLVPETTLAENVDGKLKALFSKEKKRTQKRMFRLPL